MKTSNKLLILLLAVSLLAMIGSDFALKAKFDKIDRKDPYFGYSHEILKPFKFVKLTGNQARIVQIQPGKSFELMKADMRNYSNKPEIKWQMSGDTLVIIHKAEGKKQPFFPGRFGESPALYITAPTLSGVISQGVTSNVKNWAGQDFFIKQTGNGIQLTNNRFENLKISISSGGYLQLSGKNTLGITEVQCKDSSELVVDKDNFKSFKMQADSNVRISLPGGLIQKISAL